MLKRGRYKRIMISVPSTRSPASLLALSSFLCLATWPTYRSFEKNAWKREQECYVSSQGLKVEDVGMEGEGLVFIVYRLPL